MFDLLWFALKQRADSTPVWSYIQVHSEHLSEAKHKHETDLSYPDFWGLCLRLGGVPFAASVHPVFHI